MIIIDFIACICYNYMIQTRAFALLVTTLCGKYLTRLSTPGESIPDKLLGVTSFTPDGCIEMKRLVVMPKRKPKQLEFDYVDDIGLSDKDEMTKEEKAHQYYEKNKEHVKAKSRQYRKDNPEKCKEKDRLYHENNKEKLKAKQRQHYQDNKKDILENCRLYRQEHKEEAREYNRQYRIDNKEELKEQKRIYWLENGDEFRAKKKQYREDNPELVKEQSRQTYERNKETIKHRNKLYSQKNPEIALTNSKRRRFRKKNLESTLTSKEWQKILDDHFHCCHYCGKKSDDLHQEHKIPVSKGGGYTKENIIPSCPDCNHAKFTTDYEDFVERNNDRMQLTLFGKEEK